MQSNDFENILFTLAEAAAAPGMTGYAAGRHL